MRKEAIERFLNKKVKLVQTDNWCLYGQITDVYDDSLIFRSDTRESIILLENIKEIVGGC